MKKSLQIGACIYLILGSITFCVLQATNTALAFMTLANVTWVTWMFLYVTNLFPKGCTCTTIISIDNAPVLLERCMIDPDLIKDFDKEFTQLVYAFGGKKATEIIDIITKKPTSIQYSIPGPMNDFNHESSKLFSKYLRLSDKRSS